MKVAIIGYGVEGKSACTYWLAKGDDVTVCDQHKELELPDGVAAKLGADYLEGLEEFDLLVRAPGVNPDQLPDAVRITSVTNEFMEQCPAPIIGVTGTKGKGTTSSLIEAMLKNAGITVFLGGNIGTPALDFIGDVQEDNVVVLELSSFQLIDAHVSPHIAVCLMIAPEHQDWHANLSEYFAAKGNIFAHQLSGDVAIFNANSVEAVKLSKLSSAALKLPYDVEGDDEQGAYVKDGAIYYQHKLVCQVAEIALLGKHNLQNVCAAVAAASQITDDYEAMAKAIREFTGLPHRLQVIATVNGVTYADDSISTTPESAMAAIQAFDQPKVLILGGSDKGADFTELAEEISRSDVRAVVALGEEAPKIVASLQAANYPGEIRSDASSMQAAVSAAYELAKEGDAVLLSPACASFGMFKNYKDRGDQFVAAVSELV